MTAKPTETAALEPTEGMAAVEQFLEKYVVHSTPGIVRNWATLRADAGRHGRVIERLPECLTTQDCETNRAAPLSHGERTGSHGEALPGSTPEGKFQPSPPPRRGAAPKLRKELPWRCSTTLRT